jgi:hypothetical protein
MRQMHESLTVLIQVGNDEYEILANLKEKRNIILIDSVPNTIDLNLHYFYIDFTHTFSSFDSSNRGFVSFFHESGGFFGVSYCYFS